MAHKGSKNKLKNNKPLLSLKGFTFVLLLGFLFYPPYFRGLFFPETQHGALIFAAILFWLTWFTNRNEENVPVLGYKMDYLILAFVGTYILASFEAANLRLAVNEIVKAILYFLVYWMVSRNVKSLKDIVLVLKTLYFSGLGVALAGLMTATEIISINDGFIFGRIASTLQYANATGGYLVAIFVLGLYLWLQGSDKAKYLYSFGNYIALTVFIATKSRGALLVLVPILILYFIGVYKKERVVSLVNVSALLILSIVVNIKLLELIIGGSFGLAWFIFILGGLLALGVQWLQGKLVVPAKVQGKYVAYTALSLVSLLVIGIAVSMVSDWALGQKITSAFNFVKEIKLDTRNSLERQYFYKDALTMIKDRPVLGYGGGGWQAAYRAYQSYNYSSRQVHNHYLQTWVETGTIGITILISIWGYFLFRVYGCWRQKNEHWTLIWVTALSALSLGIHAIIDFDLSLSALTIVIFSIIGIHTKLGNSSAKGKLRFKFSNCSKSTNLYKEMLIPTVLSIALIVLSSSYLVGSSYFKQATRTSSPYLAAELLDKSIMYDPLSANSYARLGEAYSVMTNFDQAISFGEKAYKLDSFNSSVTSSLAGYYFQIGDFDKSAEFLEKTKELNKYDTVSYEGLSRVFFVAGRSLLEQGLVEQAKEKFQRVIQIEVEISDTLSQLNDTEKWLWETGNFRDLALSPLIHLNIGSAYYFLGDFEMANKHLDSASSNEQILGEVYLWQSLIQKKQGQLEKAEELKQQAIKLIPPIEQDYANLEDLPILKN